MNKYKIVCIDDDISILTLLEKILEDTGHDIVCFESPIEGLDYIKENAKSVVTIICDYQLNGMNGLEVRKNLLECEIAIPFFMVTAHYSKEMAFEGMELKISSFVEKPVQREAFLKTISHDLKAQTDLYDSEFELIHSFIEESAPMLDEIEDLILILEENPRDEHTLNTYFRLLHTIKGTASCTGLISLPAFAHEYEELIGRIKKGEVQLTENVVNALLKGLDHLKSMYASIINREKAEFEIEGMIEIFNVSSSEAAEEVQKSEEEALQGEVSVTREKETPSADEKISISINKLDTFMNLAGEITVLRNVVLKTTKDLDIKYQGDHDIRYLSKTLDEMYAINSQLQNMVAEMRKVSLLKVYKPLKRIVRDATRDLNKEVEFMTQGEELRVDTRISKVLSETLVHIIRNAIDHGIEKTSDREQSGKNRKGKLHLHSHMEGELLIVKIVDDGKGIDPERLKLKALEHGIYSDEQLSKISDQKLFEIIFHSGLSTAEKVTSLSGRGVGMDMVKSTIEGINGKIFINSELNKGTEFHITLPLPRSIQIMTALIVDVASKQFAIPFYDIGEIVNIPPESVESTFHMVGEKEVFKLKDEIIPIVRLTNELKLNSENIETSDGARVVILRNDDYKYGIIVDNVFSSAEIVVKKISKNIMTGSSSFLGAALMGNQEMALVLDLETIAASNNMLTIDNELVQLAS